MDFDFNDEQQAVADLATQILHDKLTHERLSEIERGDEWFARDEWLELAKSNLLGISLPEHHGGNGLGIFEACIVLEAIGHHVAPLPYLATVVMGAMPIAEFGNDAQQARWLPGVVDGSTILTAALVEPGSPLPPTTPATRAERTGDGWYLEGEKVFVPAAHLASAMLVPASTTDGTSVFLVDPKADGVELERIDTTSGEPQFIVRMTGVSVAADAVLGELGGGDAVTDWITERTVAGLCATQAGVCEAALRMTAKYTSERQQFNAPIATFQAVAQRAADAFIDTTGVRFTAWQAAWRLGEGLPAKDEIDIAKFWAADAGQRVVHAAQHLHGGIGVDKDYPLHRYFLWAKTIELAVGGATDHLRAMGARMAAETP
jgi:alkylation response protein AidB-like acyl-CoA dehydrogenase